MKLNRDLTNRPGFGEITLVKRIFFKGSVGTLQYRVLCKGWNTTGTSCKAVTGPHREKQQIIFITHTQG